MIVLQCMFAGRPFWGEMQVFFFLMSYIMLLTNSGKSVILQFMKIYRGVVTTLPR